MKKIIILFFWVLAIILGLGLITWSTIFIAFPYFYGNLLNRAFEQEKQRNERATDLIQNREKYLASDKSLFIEPQKVKNVGVTKYNDFYIITDKGYPLLPYGRELINNKPGVKPYKYDIISQNDIRLLNLEKTIGKEIKITVLADKNFPYEFKINEVNKKDVYPLNENNYYMVDLNLDGYYLDMNFNLCNQNYSIKKDFHCDEKTSAIYPRQKYWEGEKN